MPKHKVFVEQYGRSTKYARKKNRREYPRQILIVDDSDDDDNADEPVDSSNAGLSASENYSENSGNPSPHQILDVCDADDVPLRNQDNASENDVDSVTSDNPRFDDGTDLEFNDDDGDDEYYDAENRDEVEPLFEGASITLGESMLAILSFALCYNLTGVALGDLLVLISLICGPTCILKTSLYSFKKHFGNIRYPLIKHYYCSVCCTSLATSTSVCESSNVHNGVSYFIEIPIVSQLQMLFDRPGFYGSLHHRFHHEKDNLTNLDDIYDGNVYRELSRDNEVLATPSNISFTWNTDGVPIFKSSGYQIWPFYLSINELPFRERTKPENILLAGLWFGPQKPSPNIFLQPLKTALRDISEGVYLNVPNKASPVKVKGIIICGTCDLPAKALFLNMTQFNGRYGCPKCKLQGRSEEGVWTYPFERRLDTRTEEESRDYAEKALTKDAPVFGIKGLSLLDLFVHKYIRTTAVDSMHCVFAGVVKKLCAFFFDPAFSNHPASLRGSIDLVDSRLCDLSPPSFLQRRPRSIQRHFKYWKANELKAWLFYYSLPILHDVMLPEYFEHYCMLALGIYTLHQPSVHVVMLEKASRLLTEFVNRFDVLYGERYMSCNLHQLLHLPETVRDFGPLWVTSCFAFEDLNGKLKRLVHSSRHPELQICNAVASFLNLTALRKKNLQPGSHVDLYCAALVSPRRKMRLEYVTEGIQIVGRCCETVRLPDIVASALARANVFGRKFKTFSRLLKNHSLYTSDSYSRCIKYNNTCVRYNHDESENIGVIQSFVKVYNCVCQVENMCECYTPIYAIIRQCIASPVVSHDLQAEVPELLSECTGIAEQVVAVNVQQLVTVYFFLKIRDTGKQYIAMPANAIEAE